MFNRSCGVDFLVPHFWAAFLMLNPLSRTSFTAFVKVVDSLLFCVLQLLRKGLYTVQSISTFGNVLISGPKQTIIQSERNFGVT